MSGCGQQNKKRSWPEEPPSSVLTFFNDGTFKHMPVETSSNDAGTMPRNSKRQAVTTVFAADGRFVHLRHQATPPAILQGGHRHGSCGRSLLPQQHRAGLCEKPAVWDVKSGNGGHGVSEKLCEGGTAAPSKSWLDSRLERARLTPAPARAPAPTELETVTLELRVARTGAGCSTASAAKLRISASSTEVLQSALTESVGGLLATVKPLK
ncbi:unnamed protein product [Effrenium voratum]|nr:unnamed protein product [Effrenium voratum]